MPPSPWCSRRDARWPCCSPRSCSAPRRSEGEGNGSSLHRQGCGRGGLVRHLGGDHAANRGEAATQSPPPSLGSARGRTPAGSASRRPRPTRKGGEFPAGPRLIREGNASSFVLLRVKPPEPPAYKRDLDPAY